MTKRLWNNKIMVLSLLGIVAIRSGLAVQTIFSSLQYLLYVAAAVFLFPVLADWWGAMKRGDIGYVLFTLFAVMSACTLLFSGDESIGFYSLFGCTVLVAFGVAKTYSLRQVANIFLWCMTGIACISLVGYVLSNYTNVFSHARIFINANEVPYVLTFCFNFIPQIAERNCGVFWEPGLFASYLTLGIILEVIYTKSVKKLFRIVLFSVGILTAHSSAGYVVWGLSLLFWVVYAIQDKITPKITIVVGIFLLAIGIAAFFGIDFIISHTSLANNEYIAKLSIKQLFSSLRARAVLHNLKMFLAKPLFGNGIDRVVLETEFFDYVADTSTMTYMLSIFGGLGVLYLFAWGYGIFGQKNLHIVVRCILFVIALCITNKEPHLNNVFSWLILFLLVKTAQEPKKDKNDWNLPLYGRKGRAQCRNL